MFLGIDMVVTIFYFINYPVHDFNQEDQLGKFCKFPDNIRHSEIADVIEGIR